MKRQKGVIVARQDVAQLAVRQHGNPHQAVDHGRQVVQVFGAEAGLDVGKEEGENVGQRGQKGLEWKFVSCSHCQELGQQAGWLLIGYTRVNNQSEVRSAR